MSTLKELKSTDTLTSKKFRSVFFEYYKQGFLFGNYLLSGMISPSKEEKSLLESSVLNLFSF